MEKLKSFIVNARLKEAVSEVGLRVASGAVEALDQVVKDELGKAVERAKANGRKTIQPHDILPPKK